MRQLCRHPDQVVVERDPMLDYSSHAKPTKEVEQFTFTDVKALTSEIPLWCINAVPAVRQEMVRFLEKYGLRRAELIKQMLDLEGDFPENLWDVIELEYDYITGYQRGAERILNLLADLFQNHPDGLYWVLASARVAPEQARVLADIYEGLKATGFDPNVVTTITDLLRVWRERHEARAQEPPSGANAAKEEKGTPGP
jgi:hypothetical protein